MIDFLTIISEIKKYAPQARQQIINQAQKNDAVIKVLKELKLNPTEIPDDVDTVYVYTLVEYGVFKPKAILNLLVKKEIKDYFWEAYTSNSPFKFENNTRKFLDKNIKLQQKINDEDENINLLDELEDFGKVFISVAKRTNSRKPQFQPPYPDWDLDVYPKEFKALILEKTRLFCGRKFVFEAFEEFLQTKTKGYFTVIGDAGMGKSAIASKYVLETKCPCYFNIFAEGRNKPEQFLASIRQQLIKRYSLQNTDTDNLRTLLQNASNELQKGQQLVIVIDALDEVEQEGNGNLLDLPQSLPERCYFFLTRRPYDKQEHNTRKGKRLTVSENTHYHELDLREGNYQKLSREDVKKYIHSFLKMDKSEIKLWIQQLLQNQAGSNTNKYDVKGEVITLNEWQHKQNLHLTETEFVNILTEKSQNNFMYLRYVLPSIATGKYNDLSLQGLPEGLENYYIKHWQRMGMDQDNKDLNVKILFILVVRDDAVSSNMIAEILHEDIFPVDEILAQWVEYVTPKQVEEEGKEKTYYTIYHRSFWEFLQKRPKLDAKKNRKRFQEVKEKMDKFFDINIF